MNFSKILSYATPHVIPRFCFRLSKSALQRYHICLKFPNFDNVVNCIMANSVEYNLKFTIDGKEGVVKVTDDVKQLAEELSIAKDSIM